jgi:hypothetical protein
VESANRLQSLDRDAMTDRRVVLDRLLDSGVVAN